MKRTSTSFVRSLMSASVVLGGASAVYGQAVTVDGQYESLYGFPRVWQTVQTQYGDNSDASTVSANGSELVSAHSYIGGGNLNLFIAGNLQTNGNRIYVFIDTNSATGQNRLRGDNLFSGASWNLTRMGDSGGPNGLQFETGFTPDHAFVVNANTSSCFVDYSNLPTSSGGAGFYLGASPAGGASGGALSGGSNTLFVQAALRNGNLAGVGGGNASGQTPSIVNSGLEMSIPMSSLGTIDQSIKVFVFITDPTSAFLSNQFLPDVGANGGTVSNFNEPRGVNFGATGNPGTQFFYVQPRTKPQVWVNRLGNGAASLGGTSTQASLFALDLVTPNQLESVITTLSTNSGVRLTNSGSATSEGYMQRSSDGQVIALAGYDAPTNFAGVATSTFNTTTLTGTFRSVAVVDGAGGQVIRRISAYSGNNVRSATAFNSSDFWAGGATSTVASGMVYGQMAGTTITSLIGSSTVNSGTTLTASSNIRNVKIFNNRLYMSSGAGNSVGLTAFPFLHQSTFAGAVSLLVTPAQPYDFAFSNARTVYVADDQTASAVIAKYTFNGSSWSLAGSVSSATLGSAARGLTIGQNAAGQTVIYVTTSSATGNRVVSITDTSVGTVTSFSAPVTLATAAANFIYRGIDWSPQPWLTPTANTDTGTTDEDTTLNVSAPGVLANDTGEVLGGVELVTALTPPAAGSLTLNANGSYQFIPAANYSGSASFTYRFTDGDTFSAPATVNLTVNAQNDAPTLAAIPNQTVDELQTLNFTASGSDIDGPSLTYSLSGAPAGASIDPGTGIFSWTPTEAQGAGVYNFSVVVSDGSLSDPKPVQVTVNEVNQNPTLAAVTNQTVEEGSLLTFNLSGTDNDLPSNSPAATLTYSLTGAPSGMTVDGSTGVVTWTPTLAQGPQVYNFTAVVTDGLGGSDSEAVQVTVTEPNSAPVLDAIGNQSVTEDYLLTLTASATDANVGQTLTYSLGAGAPYGCYINPSTGVFRFRPAPIQTPNTFTVTVIVSDGNGGTDSKSFQIAAARETRTAAQVWAWGSNLFGNLGIGSSDNIPYPNPVQVSGLVGVSRIFNSLHDNFGRLPDTSWKVWGENQFGALGDGTTTVRNAPVTVAALFGYLEAGGGYRSAQGMTSSGTLSTWGWNNNGQLGLGDFMNRSVPTAVPSISNLYRLSRAFGPFHTVIQATGSNPLTDGSVRGTGENSQGPLGIGVNAVPNAYTLSNITSGAISTSSSDFTSFVVKQDGTLWVSGLNNQGQLGIGSLTNSYSFQQVPTLSDVVDACGGEETGYALKADGTVWAWGKNDQGQLGDGTTTQRLTPVQVSGLSNVVDIEAQYFGGYALKADGTVWAWGSNNNIGALGDGSATGFSTVPIQVPGLTGIDRIAAGYSRCFAIKYGVLNAAPVANADTYAATEDTTLTVNAASGVIANDTDDQSISGLSASVVSAPNPAQGSLTLNPNGSFTFTPAANFNGPATFTYRVNDGSLDSNTATVTINVGAENDAPTLAAIPNQTVDELVTLNFTAIGNDIDGPSLTYSLTGAPAGASIDPVTGIFSWTPTEPQGPGVFNFNVVVSDGSLSDSKPVQVTVAEVNLVPNVAPIPNQSTDELVPFAYQVSASDNDLPAQTLTYSLVSAPAGCTIDSAGLISWTPTEAQGPQIYNFTVSVSDGVTAATTGIQVQVVEANVAPTANAQTVSVTEDTPTNITLTATDSDLPADTLTFTVVSGPTFGSLSGTGANRIYTPQLNFSGTDTFTFKVNDGTADSNVATVTLNVSNVNDMQVSVVGSSAPNAFGSPSWAGYRANALTSLETTPGDDLGSRLTDPTAYDAVTTIPWYDNTATGTPFWMGAINPLAPFDSELGHRLHFGVRVLGNGTRFSLAELEFDMNSSDPGNDMDFDGWFDGTDPFGGGPEFYGPSRRGIDYGPDRLKGTMDDVVYNTDSTPAETEVDELIYVGIGNAWDATQEPGGTPAEQLASLRCYLEDLAPIDVTTSYSIRDGGHSGALLATGSATVTLVPTNTLPTASSQSVTVAEDSSVGITLVANDPDAFEVPLGYTVVSGPSHGSFSGTAPNLVYTPNANYNGPDSFTFKASDCVGDSNTATVTINVTPVNDDPILGAIGDQTIPEMTAFSLPLSSTDIDGGAPVYSGVGLPGGASVSGNVFTWTPSEAQGPGSYTFTLQVSDGAGGTDSETITINVTEVNVAPTIDAITDQTVDEMTLVTFDADGNDSDLPANTLTYSLIGAPSGAAINASTGEFTWTPTEAQGPNSYTFTVRVSDGALTADESVTITVNEVNVAPTIDPIAPQNVNELVALTFTAEAEDSDDPTQTVSYSLVGAPSGASINASTGEFTWTPTEAQGPNVYTFTVRASDGTLNADTTVQVTVAEVNIAPVANGQTVGTMVNTPVNITLDATDADLPANTLTYTIVDNPASGVLTGTGPNRTYTPNLNFNGTDTFTFKVNDGTADSNIQTVTVNVSGITVTLNLQLQGFSAPGPTTRGMTMFLGGTAGGSNAPVDVSRDVVFSATGAATVVFTPVDGFDPAANLADYAISVKDELHTLRKTVGLTWNGTGYTAAATVLGGNINRDHRVDIGDYIVYATRFGTTPGGDTPLTLLVNPSFRHADISGNGVVDSGDFSFISANFGFLDEAQVGNYGRPDPTIRTRMTVADAIREAGRDAQRLDRNGDGWISLSEATGR